MKIAAPLLVENIKEMQAWSREQRTACRRVGFVPTMGGLHEGHLSLMKIAMKHCDRVVVSIFVNPTQFGPGEDYRKYPRDLERDMKLLADLGVDVCFAPKTEAIYLSGDVGKFELGWGTDRLCGASRPGHFDGVSNVLVRLFNAVLPDEAVFGQKDAQQALIVKRMVDTLHFPIDLTLGKIVREPDGLAMSSRNAYLSAAERERSIGLFGALKAVGGALSAGERDPGALAALGRAKALAVAGAEVEYFELLEPATLGAPSRIGDGLLLIACAIKMERARLIDNHVYRIEGENVSEALLF